MQVALWPKNESGLKRIKKDHAKNNQIASIANLANFIIAQYLVQMAAKLKK
jgi:ribonuclease I